MKNLNQVPYGEFCAALAKPGEAILKSMTPNMAHILHMAVGVSGEAGELLDAVKKNVIYGKPMDMKNVIEELGDIEFYLENLRQAVGVTREQTITANKEKLGVRYSSGAYSDKQAQERADKIATGETA